VSEVHDREQRAARRIATAGWTLAAAALAAFVALSFVARGRAVVPCWREERFVRLSAVAPPGTGERWVVAVQPACPRCRAALPALIAAAPRASVAVLLVDTGYHWPADSLAAPGTATVYWDSAGIWRREWRRESYDEILLFDRGGRLERVIPPGAPLRAGDRR
jgi:hypothetical protein